MDDKALNWHDVDNRLKDIMDALQGRAGGSKKVRALSGIIPNDRQIFRIVIEKSLPPKQSKGFGHLIVTKYGGKRSNLSVKRTGVAIRRKGSPSGSGIGNSVKEFYGSQK